jgi:protein MBA1
MTWKVIKSRNWPATRVVSNRALELSLPGHPQTWIRQVVIRVKTRQRLVAKQSPTTKPEVQAQIQQPISKGKRKALAWTPDGGKPSTEVEEAAVENAVEAPLSTETEKDVTEYLVLQKRVLLGVEDKEWKIQGFASETTLESIASDEKYIREMIAFQTPA